jgi:hypothetical protein
LQSGFKIDAWLCSNWLFWTLVSRCCQHASNPSEPLAYATTQRLESLPTCHLITAQHLRCRKSFACSCDGCLLRSTLNGLVCGSQALSESAASARRGLGS